MSRADSEAAIEQHCNNLVPDGTLTTLLVNHGGHTAVAPTDEQFKDFATQVNGGNDMSFEMQAHPRRLHFEASATSDG